MNRSRIHARAHARAALVLATLLCGGLLAAGCVYRPNIQQGNLLEVEDVEKVEPGMTRSQVRYLLGTPMLTDPFDPQRWDYIYTFKRGRESKIDRSHFVVHFEGDRVSRVEMLDLPDRARGSDRRKDEDGTGPREPPPLPSIEQRPPDAPRPDDRDG